MPEVITKWYLSIIGKLEDYVLNFDCPHCKKTLSNFELAAFTPNKKVDEIVECFYCDKKFKLIIKEITA